MSQVNSSTTVLNKKKLLDLYRQAVLSDLPLSEVDQKLNNIISRKQVKKKLDQAQDKAYQNRLWSKLPKAVRLATAALPLLLMAVGIALAGSALWPIASHYLPFTQTDSGGRDLLSPMSASQWAELSGNQVYAKETVIDQNNSTTVLNEPVISNRSLDYTDLNNWFAGDPILGQAVETATEYHLDIPQVDIHSAVVRVGGTDLNKSLIQYPGTALPGQPGAPVIFGHSILRQFYNPSEKNPKRYGSIFSKIMTLQPGDEIYLTHDNVKYTYRVVSNHEVKPSDTFILAQRYDARQLKLVTCVPEGTTLRRGVVVAELIKGN